MKRDGTTPVEPFGCSYYRCSFDGKDGGGMVQLEYERYMKPEEADEETVAI